MLPVRFCPVPLLSFAMFMSCICSIRLCNFCSVSSVSYVLPCFLKYLSNSFLLLFLSMFLFQSLPLYFCMPFSHVRLVLFLPPPFRPFQSPSAGQSFSRRLFIQSVEAFNYILTGNTRRRTNFSEFHSAAAYNRGGPTWIITAMTSVIATRLMR